MFTVRLSARQNPDMPPRDDLPRARTLRVATLEEASERCHQLIAEHDVGGGKWGAGRDRDAVTGVTVAKVSYNGRVWTPKLGGGGMAVRR